MLVRIRASKDGISRDFTFADGATSADIVADFDLGLDADVEAVFTRNANARELGRKMFDWLLAGILNGQPASWIEPIYLFFEKADADEAGDPVARLEQLPWELLCNAAGGYLARQPQGGVVRVMDIGAGDQPPSEPFWPLRVLAVSGASKVGDDELATDKELQRLREAFVGWGRSVQLEVIERTTNEKLTKAIKSDCPQILHYCGHTLQLDGIPAGLKTASTIPGETDTYSVDQIGELGQPPIGLVMLNACKSAMSRSQTSKEIWTRSLEGMFLGNGSRAVVAMQADIAGADASQFAAAFYQHCLTGDSLELVMVQARQAIDVANCAWAIPRLTLAWMPTAQGYRLFDKDKRVKKVIPFGSDNDHTPRFLANFHRQRRLLSNWLCDRPCQTSPRGPVALLTGDANTGKSHLVRWMLSSAVHQGYQCRNIDFAAFSDSEPVTLVRLLRAIRDGGPRNADGTIAVPNALCKELAPAGAFSDFNGVLNKAFPIAPPGVAPAPAGAGIPDLYGTGEVDQLDTIGGSTFNEAAAQAFCAALRKSAQSAPLLVVIDLGRRAERISASEFEPFLTHVINAECAAWQHGGKTAPLVRFILCCDAQTQRSHLRPLTSWFDTEMNVPLLSIIFERLADQDELLRNLQEMYWFKEASDISNLFQVFKKGEKKLTWEVCATFHGIVQQFESIWQNLNHQDHGIGEMQ